MEPEEDRTIAMEGVTSYWCEKFYELADRFTGTRWMAPETDDLESDPFATNCITLGSLYGCKITVRDDDDSIMLIFPTTADAVAFKLRYLSGDE